MLAALVARVMGKSRPTYADGSYSVVANPRGDLSIVEGMPIKTEYVRQGGTWMAVIPTASAFTYVNAWPTTRGELVLYNGDSQLSYVIDSAFMVDVSSAAAAQSKALLAQLVAPGNIGTIPTANTGVLLNSRSGRLNYGGAGVLALANTAMGQVANKWESIAAAPGNPNSASIGTAAYTDLYGGWIVPPKGGIAFAGLASTAAGTAIIGVTWSEILLPVVS
jgi:hypothetical protein